MLIFQAKTASQVVHNYSCFLCFGFVKLKTIKDRNSVKIHNKKFVKKQVIKIFVFIVKSKRKNTNNKCKITIYGHKISKNITSFINTIIRLTI